MSAVVLVIVVAAVTVTFVTNVALSFALVAVSRQNRELSSSLGELEREYRALSYTRAMTEGAKLAAIDCADAALDTADDRPRGARNLREVPRDRD